MTQNRSNILTLNPLAVTLSQTAKLIDAQHFLSDVESTALQVLLYLDCYIAFIKTEKKYLPLTEFNLLIDAINGLPRDNFLLPDLTKYLIDVSDVLLKEHADNAECKDLNILEKIKTTLGSLPVEVFSPISELTSSITSDFLVSKLSKPIVLNAKELVKGLEKSMDDFLLAEKREENKRYYEKRFNEARQDLKIVFGDEGTSFTPEMKQDNEDALIRLIKCYVIMPDPCNFIKLINFLQGQHSNKIEFSKKCLSWYQAAASECPRKSYALNKILSSTATFLSILDEPLKTGELKQAITDVGFYIPNPSATENDDDYKAYSKVVNVVLDEKQVDFLNIKSMEDLLQRHRMLKISGKQASGVFTLSSSSVLSKLPVLMEMTVMQYSPPIIEDFELMIQLYIKVNENAVADQKRNIALFFNKYYLAVIQLINVMGIEAVHYLRKQIAGTVLTLERTLDPLPKLESCLIKPLADYFSAQHMSTAKHPDEVEAFKTCLIVLSLLNEMRDKYLADKEIQELNASYMQMSKGRSPKEFLRVLSSDLLKKLFKDQNTEFTDEKIIQIFERVSPEIFSRLAAAAQKMEKDEYRDVFLKLLALDLMGGDVDTFLHDVEQQDSLGRNLAYHNQAIREKLLEHGISPQTALEYDKHYRFMVVPSGKTDASIDNLRAMIWSYVMQLKKAAEAEFKKINPDDRKNTDRANAILKHLSALKEMVDKRKAQSNNKLFSIVDVFSNKLAIPLLDKVIKNCDALRANNVPIKDDVYEFSDHLKRQMELIENSREEKSTDFSRKKKVTPYYFSVEQWPKEKAATFFLGDLVGCCLASNGAQFQAMVQRRMDDAMLFHVAVDQSNKDPVALIWLYLLETQDHRIMLMANFFEVATKYGKDNELRKSLFNGLLQFTHQYLQDNPGIDGFYINKLTYGWNEHDADSYPLVPLKIVDKLGGAYIPGRTPLDGEEKNYEVSTLAREKYFLVSLSKDEFRQFNPKVLAEEISQNLVSVDTLIQKFVFKQSATETNIDKVIKAIIAKHRIELQPFFGQPLNKDEDFYKLVVTAFEKAISYRLSRGETMSPARLVSGLFPIAGFSQLKKSDQGLAKGKSNERNLGEEKQPGKKI